MYRSIWQKYREMLDKFPKERRPLVGAVIKEMRVDKGIRQMDFAKETRMNGSTLKSFENDHQRSTTVENLERCAKLLGLTVDEAILLGRERDPANYFVFKKTPPPQIKGIKKRVKAPMEWHESKRLQFKDFDITPISAPIMTKKDFFVMKLILPPKREITDLALGAHYQVQGFIAAGFNIKVGYKGEERILTTNQGFGFDGFYPHHITNDDEDSTAVIYLLTRFPDFENVKTRHESRTKPLESIDIALGVEKLREHKSDRKGQLISVKHLADLTNGLDHEQIHKLMRIKRGSSVIYWQKIEDLLAGTDTSMDEFLKWAKNEDKRYFSVATAETRVVIDYHNYHGVKIYSAVPPGINSDYFMGEISVEGRNSITKKSWERKDKAMIALYLEEGELEITVGKKRSALPILKGESIYFDGSLGYILRNPGEAQAKGFFASYPAIRF